MHASRRPIEYPPLVEPDPIPPRPPARARWLAFAAAALAALAGSQLAPQPWPAGVGRVEASFRGEVVASRPVTVGDGAPVRFDGMVHGHVVDVVLPKGVPVRGHVEAAIAVTRDGLRIRPPIADVRLAVELPDGRREPVPPSRWDEEEQVLRASRRAPARSAVVLAVLGMVVVLWVSEALPLWVTSLSIPVVMVVSGAGGAQEALAPFFHPIIALFFGGFLMAEAMRRAGLDRYVALSIVAHAGRSPALLFASMLGVAAFLSMWMSNTAATAVLVPIAIAVTAPIGHAGYRRALVLGIAYAATTGGVGSVVGTPANPLAIEFLATFAGRRITFAEWFLVGLPYVVLFLPMMGAFLWWRSDVRIAPESFAAVRSRAREELARTGRPDPAQTVVLACFALVVAAWLTQAWHGVSTGIVALGGAVLMAMLGRIQTEDLGRISWAALLTFGGGLALGFFMVESGTSDWIATRLTVLRGVPPLVGVGIVAALTLALTTVASNTATAAMLIPLAIPIAAVIGAPPTAMVLVIAIASSIDYALVVGTPPTMIAYSTGLFTTREIFRAGVLLDLAGVLLLVLVVVQVWRMVGL